MKREELFIEIQSGEGGRDSKLFVDDMFSMYSRWSKSN
jgi:protein subunit release factor A